MFFTKMSWKLAFKQMRNQKRQTFLSLVGGCIGTALVIATVIFYSSFNGSGKDWLDSHFGVIDWQLNPPNKELVFTGEQLTDINELLKDRVHQVKTVMFESSALKRNDTGQLSQGNFLVIGVHSEDMIFFAKDNQDKTYWDNLFKDDGAVLSDVAAAILEADSQNNIQLRNSENTFTDFTVTAIVNEQGLTGYRGQSRSSGTVLVSIDKAQQLLGLDNNEYNSILVMRKNPTSQAAPVFPFGSSGLFEVLELKNEAVQKIEQLKINYGMAFIVASSFATLCGAILLYQLLRILLNTRQDNYRILHQIGVSRGVIRGLFYAEATLFNIISNVIGGGLGIVLGYTLVSFFGLNYSTIVQQYESLYIPITHHFSIADLLIMSIAIFLVLTVITLILGKNIKLSNEVIQKAKKSTIEGLKVTACALILGLHIIHLTTNLGYEWLLTMSRNLSIEGLLVLGGWLLASFAALFLFFKGIHLFYILFEKIFRLLRFPRHTIKLVIHYAKSNFIYSFGMSLLLSLVVMIFTTAVLMNSQFFVTEQEADTEVLGFNSLIPYYNNSEKEYYLTKLNDNDILSEKVRSTIVEPYRLNIQSDALVDMNSFSIVTTEDEFIKHSNIKLINRAPQFNSDAEAWEALGENSHYIIMDKKFLYKASEWTDNYSKSGLPLSDIKAGSQLELQIFKKSQLGEEKVVDAIETFEVIGFVDTDPGIRFYDTLYVSPTIYDKYRANGFQWPNTPELGYIMFNLADNDVQEINEIMSLLYSEGVTKVEFPTILHIMNKMMQTQVFSIYLSFIVVTIFIGIFGLIVIQYKSVFDRKVQFGVLRFIGLNKNHVRQILFMEGLLIGIIGIVNGLLFGISGGYLLYIFGNSLLPPTEEKMGFILPYMELSTMLVFVVVLIIIAAWLPSRQINNISPSDVIKSAD